MSIGVCYAVLNVTIRRLITRSMPMPIILSTVSSVGVVSLGLAAIARTGWEPLAATELTGLGVMFIAGTFNAVAFFWLTKALQLVSIVQVNAVMVLRNRPWQPSPAWRSLASR